MTLLVRVLAVVCFSVTMFVAALEHDSVPESEKNHPSKVTIRTATYWHFTRENFRRVFAKAH